MTGSETQPLLALERCTIQFGGLTAVSALELCVRGNELIGLIGPNGAGKTTVFNLITGIYQPTSGEILFEGQPITPDGIAMRHMQRTLQRIILFNKSVIVKVLALAVYVLYKALADLPPDKIVRRGITRTFQNIRLFN